MSSNKITKEELETLNKYIYKIDYSLYSIKKNIEQNIEDLENYKEELEYIVSKVEVRYEEEDK